MKKHLTNAFGCFLIVSLAAVLHGCDLSGIIEDALDETEESEDGESQLITAKIDGKDFSARNDLIEMELTHLELNMFFFGITAGEPQFHEGEGVVGAGIGLVFYGQNFSSLAKGTLFKPVAMGELPFTDDYYVEGFVVEDLENNDFEYEARAQETIEVAITEIDHENKWVSGKFEFTAYDEDRDKYIKVTDGEFKNIRWGEK